MRRKKIGILMVGILFAFGCAKEYWLANIEMMRAEKAFEKAYSLRIREGLHEERLKLYREACTAFSKAYDYDERIFTLNRISWAAQSCEHVQDFKNAELFRLFEVKYTQEHPKEVEHGDDVPTLGIE